MKIKAGDNVIVISGKDKGKKGKVVTAFPKKNKVVVEGVNVAKKRTRPRKEGEKGQVIQKTMPVHVSNVQLVDSKSGKRTRIGSKLIKDKKVRIARKTGAEI